MNWQVVKELGIEYPLNPNGNAREPTLRSPIRASKTKEGKYLIVDEICAEKPIPFRMEYRTMLIDANGSLLFDTWHHGIEDGFGCLAGSNSIAILRRTKWELLLFHDNGKLDKAFDLTTFSNFLPRMVTWTHRDTFLISFLDRSRKLDIIEVDRSGRLQWYLPSAVDYLGVPASVQAATDETFLVADAFWHVVYEFDRHGTIVWQFGEPGAPAKAMNCVSGPGHANMAPNGRRLIADTRNHRVLSVSQEGEAKTVGPGDGLLSDPACVEATTDENLVICDGGNARVIESDEGGNILWQFGQPLRSQRHFCFPRSVEFSNANQYLIADTANDRIVQADRSGTLSELQTQEAGLFWPRCVRWMPSGSLLIADGRRGRIIEMSTDGHIINELCEVQANGQKKLEDPHDVRLLPNGHLLVTDSPLDAVFETDWSGHVYRSIDKDSNVDLSDPHSAQLLKDGAVVVCDTGHHRVLSVSESGIKSIETIEGNSGTFRMNRPRYAEIIDDGTMVIADTGNNRILAVTLTGQLIWELTEIPDSPIPRLFQPRWAKLLNREEVVVTDHFHHRIVHLVRNCVDSADTRD